MNRKILSLILALMMIVSVAIALPVSASANQSFVINACDMTLAETGSNSSTYRPSASTLDWVTTGAINTGASPATYTFSIDTVGSYAISAAIAGTSGKVTATIDGKPLATNKSITQTTALNDPKETTLGVMYLDKGSHTISLIAKDIFTFDIKFEYAGNYILLDAVNSTSNGTMSSDDTPKTDYEGYVDYATKGCYWLDTNQTASFTFEVAETAHYNIYSVAAPANQTYCDQYFDFTLDGVKYADYVKLPILESTNSRTRPLEYNAVSGVILEKGTTHTITYKSRSSWIAFYNIKIEYAGALTDAECSVNLNAGTQGTYTHGNDTYGAQYSDQSASSTTLDYVNKGACWLTPNGYWTCEFEVIKTGVYDIYAAVGVTDSAMFDFTINGEKLVSSSWLTNSTGYKNATETRLAQGVLLTAGEKNTIIYKNINGNFAALYNILVKYVGEEPTPEPVADGIELVDASGNELTDVEAGDAVKAKVNFAKTSTTPENVYIVIVQYTNNTDTKQMIDAPLMQSIAVGDGLVGQLSNSITIDAECGYIKAFLWSDDGKYIPLLDAAVFAF